MSTTSSGTSLSGIFAKFVAQFLVKWVKRTLGIGAAPQRPALSATPSDVSGRPERDRSRETFGAHTGVTSPRASEMPQAAQALQGDDYGAHSGSAGPRASEMPAAVQAIQGDDYGAHRGVEGHSYWDEAEQRRAARLNVDNTMPRGTREEQA